MKTINAFSISPNPNSLYITNSIEAILYQSRQTIDKRQGLVTLLSDVGMGKTTILRYLWAEYDAREDTATCFIPTPNFPSQFAMVKSICQSFGLDPERSMQRQIDKMQEYLADQYEQGHNVVLFIDEGQMLKDPYLEQIRALLNFETNTAKLVQVVLAGQLEMWDRIKSNKNKPIKSRVHSYSLINPLTEAETVAMINFRCAAGKIANPFTAEAIDRIYEVSKGIPRLILKICDKAYDYMKLGKAGQVTLEYIDPAAEDAAVEIEAA